MHRLLSTSTFTPITVLNQELAYPFLLLQELNLNVNGNRFISLAVIVLITSIAVQLLNIRFNSTSLTN